VIIFDTDHIVTLKHENDPHWRVRPLPTTSGRGAALEKPIVSINGATD